MAVMYQYQGNIRDIVKRLEQLIFYIDSIENKVYFIIINISTQKSTTTSYTTFRR